MQKEKIPLDAIMDVVCDYFNVSKEDTLKKDRSDPYRMTRAFFCYFARVHSKYTYQKIADYLGKKTHVTTRHASNNIIKWAENDKNVREDIQNINNQIIIKNQIKMKVTNVVQDSEGLSVTIDNLDKSDPRPLNEQVSEFLKKLAFDKLDEVNSIAEENIKNIEEEFADDNTEEGKKMKEEMTNALLDIISSAKRIKDFHNTVAEEQIYSDNINLSNSGFDLSKVNIKAIGMDGEIISEKIADLRDKKD